MSTSHPAQHPCPFCEVPAERIIAQNAGAYAIRDLYPATSLHTLVIPKRHTVDYFGMTDEEVVQCKALIDELRESIMAEDDKVDGFNIGINAGVSAGQTVFHCHIHLFPRRTGDVENPIGGLRHIFPGKGAYK